MTNIPYRFKFGRIIFATTILAIAFIIFGGTITFLVLLVTKQIVNLPLLVSIIIIVTGIAVTILMSIASILAYIDIVKYQCKKETEHYLNL